MVAGGVMVVAWAIALTLLIGELFPPIALFGVLFLVSILLSLLVETAARIYLLVISILGLATTLLFSGQDLMHPESLLGFVFALVPTLATVLGITASVGAMRRWSEASARRIGQAAVVVLVAGVSVSLVASASLTDDVALPGDASMTAIEVEFRPRAMSAPSGVVGILVDNEDPFRHTFTITELGVDVELPASTARRVEFHAAPGTYTYICAVPGHEDMRGTLVIEG